jgi:hypothetical protein
VHAIENIVMAPIRAAKKLLGIGSPSKVFAEIGQWTGEGLAQGLEGSTSVVAAGARTMTQAVFPTPNVMAGFGSSAVTATAGPQVIVNVTVQGSVMAERDIATSIAQLVRNTMARDAASNGGRTGL